MKSIKYLYKTGYGPSSSHTIGPSRAAKIYKEKFPNANGYRVTLFGSLAATGRGHSTDEAILKSLKVKDVEFIWNENENLPYHPNGLRFETIAENGEVNNAWDVYSVGGGDLFDHENLIKTSPNVYELTTMDEILKWCRENGRSLWEYVEIAEGKEIWDFLEEVWKLMKKTIKQGLDAEGVLPGPLHVSRKALTYYTKAQISSGGIKDKGMIFSLALAVAEQNASGGKMVTAPTCGASGVLPAVLYFTQQNQKLPDSRILRALAVAGLIGNLVKSNGSISGAEVGCQGEIGTACSMSAAAAAYLIGGSPAQIEYAAEMGIEHYLGLTCDPIGGYVQIPCIERNAFAADTARESAVYALFSDGAHKVSFDQVVKTMVETGRDMQSAYRETGRGGLARNWKNMID
jgi:L-serine dehydratase